MSEQKDTQNEKKQTNPQGYYRVDRGEGIVFFLNEKEKHNAQIKNSEAGWYQNIPRWVGRPCYWIRRHAAVVIMLATLGNAGVAYFQWDVLSRDVQLTIESQSITREGMRADLSVSAVGVLNAPYLGVPSSVTVWIKNLGATKAKSVGADWTSWICDGPPSESCHRGCYFFRSGGSRMGYASIGRDIEQPMEVLSSVKTLEDAEAIKNERKTLYICGMVGYDDVFRNHHHILPCMYYSPIRESFMVCAGGVEY